MIFLAGQAADSNDGNDAKSSVPQAPRSGGEDVHIPSSDDGLLELLTQLANFGLNAGAPPVLGTAEPS